MSLPRVMLGGPVRDREHTAHLWLGGLLGVEYPRELLDLVLLVNDSTDGTLDACHWWADRAREEGFRRAEVIERDLGTEVDNNTRMPDRDYRAYAVLRDLWSEQRGDCEWLFPIDSDVQVPYYSLRALIGLAERGGWDLLAAVIENNWAPAQQHATNVLIADAEGGSLHSKKAFTDRDMEARPCVLTGACCVLRSSIFDAGIRYLDEDRDPHPPEDNVFCFRLAQAGRRIGYVPGIRATHWHRPPAETEWLNDPTWWERQAAYAAYRADQPNRRLRVVA